MVKSKRKKWHRAKNPTVYLIVGSNNFWYAMLTDKKDFRSEVKMIRQNPQGYSDPESGHIPDNPEMLYVYAAKEIYQD